MKVKVLTITAVESSSSFLSSDPVNSRRYGKNGEEAVPPASSCWVAREYYAIAMFLFGRGVTIVFAEDGQRLGNFLVHGRFQNQVCCACTVCDAYCALDAAHRRLCVDSLAQEPRQVAPPGRLALSPKARVCTGHGRVGMLFFR
jgi:hypothetical protein